MNSQARQSLGAPGINAYAILICTLALFTPPAADAWKDPMLARLGKLTDAELADRYRRATEFEYHVKYDLARVMIQRDVSAFVTLARQDLAHGDRQIRCVAGLILARAGHDQGLYLVLDELAAVSRTPDPEETELQFMRRGQERYFALLILGLIGDDRAVPALIAAARGPIASSRAAISLGEIGDPAAVPVLREFAAARPRDRHWAGYALARLGEDQGYDLLFDVLRSDMHWTEHRHAVRSLGKLGDDRAVPILTEVLADDGDVHVRVAAARALAEIGSSSAVPALLAALEDTEKTVTNESVTVAEVAAEAIAAIDAPLP